MKKLAILLFMLPLLAGCFMHKKMQHENRKIKGVETTNTITTEVGSKNTQISLAKQAQTDITDKTITTEKETKYSKPDSTGVQYKVIERVIEKRNNVTTRSELDELLIKTKDEQIKRIEDENKRMEYWMKEIIKMKERNETQTPWSLLFTSFVLGVVVTVVIRLWIKKAKLLQNNLS